MVAEYIALSTSLKQLIPLKCLVESVWNAIGLDINKLITIKSTIWKDNQGCVILANIEPSEMTPRSKHYAIKYRWFGTQLKPNGIIVQSISSASQLANMFTKAYEVQFSKPTD